jgi:sugar phosphate isomerase/epimerase
MSQDATRRIRSGLCSVTCRALTADEVVDLAVAAGVEAVEWGGDVHVPHGDLAAAERAAVRSVAAGLEVVSYGSYLFLDDHVREHVDPVLDTALVLGAPGVRVWCPFGTEPDAPDDERAMVTRAAALVAAAADERGLHLTLEFHAGTLTATAASTRRLLDDVGSPVLFTAWQPPYWSPRDEVDEAGDLAVLAPNLSHVHVYDWDADLTRHPLERTRHRWTERLRNAAASGDAAVAVGVPRAAMIEFVPNDDVDQLPGEVATLRACLADLSG